MVLNILGIVTNAMKVTVSVLYCKFQMNFVLAESNNAYIQSKFHLDRCKEQLQLIMEMENLYTCEEMYANFTFYEYTRSINAVLFACEKIFQFYGENKINPDGLSKKEYEHLCRLLEEHC